MQAIIDKKFLSFPLLHIRALLKALNEDSSSINRHDFGPVSRNIPIFYHLVLHHQSLEQNKTLSLLADLVASS
jgi:hypothetical protein